MKPFNLERAIAGDPLVTRDGREVKEFHYFSHASATLEPVRAVVGGSVYGYEPDGSYLSKGHVHCHDLFMASKSRTFYVNIYEERLASYKGNKSGAFDSEEEARSNAVNNSAGLLVIASPVVIEE